MKNNYQSPKMITFAKKKKYVLNLIQDHHTLELLAECLNEKQWQQCFSNPKIYPQIFILALKHLYQTQNFEEMEYELMMMNCLFSHQEYMQLKEQIFRKIVKKSIALQEYCVIRYLIPFERMSLMEIMSILYHQYHVEALECAKMCLLEDQYHLAYQYLLKLESCEDEIVLDLLGSYSMKDYLSLMRHYTKQSSYQLVMSH